MQARILFALVAVFSCIGCASVAQAQLSLTGLERTLTLSMEPQYPEPGDIVHLSISGYSPTATYRHCQSQTAHAQRTGKFYQPHEEVISLLDL